MNNITQALEEEIKLNKKESWAKLDKTLKLKKIMAYAVIYCKKHGLAHDKCLILQTFLKNKLNQRRLLTIKEIIYDINKMVIIEIPGLVVDDGIFLLQRNEKRNSTVKSLTPTKKN